MRLYGSGKGLMSDNVTLKMQAFERHGRVARWHLRGVRGVPGCDPG